MAETVSWDKSQQPMDEALKDTSFNSYGHLDHKSLEFLLVGRTIADEDAGIITSDIDKVMQSGIRAGWFENKGAAAIFEMSLEIYKKIRKAPTVNSFVQHASITRKSDDAQAYGFFASSCLGASQCWSDVPTDIAIDRMIGSYFKKTASKIYKQYEKNLQDHEVGPEKAALELKQNLIMQLTDPRGATLKETDWIDDFDTTMNQLRDMKDNPEKYAGYMCGVEAVDKRILGFRPGQLTVFVGAHGGYKTTLMLNIAYGLFLAGYNVFYFSLEMQAFLMSIKLWSLATRKVSFSRLYSGLMSSSQDWPEKESLIKKLSDGTLTNDDKEALEKRLKRLETIVGQGKSDDNDESLLMKARTDIESRKNKLKIFSLGSGSRRIKISQLDRYVQEKMTSVSPHVVIVDYLTLVDADQSRQDRKDLEIGDVCKHMRSMGEALKFSVITAAQYKRAAIDRLRKYGLDQIDKAAFGTDDIEGSNQVGADAENIGMLWKEDGGLRVRLLWPKLRYGQADTMKGDSLQVCPDISLMAGEGQIESTKAKGMTKTEKDMYEAASEISVAQDKMPAITMPDETEEEEIFGVQPTIDEDPSEYADGLDADI